jgi:hypothetical protein
MMSRFRIVPALSAASRTLQVFLHLVPGVSLRSTPGFMPTAAPRTHNLLSTPNRIVIKARPARDYFDSRGNHLDHEPGCWTECNGSSKQNHILIRGRISQNLAC